ncbi:hypothetical protein [Pseudarthrobacter enclensis]|uniref:Flagellar biosynthesis/type III secretory pathway protein FliH n=1 Tax=Pseudarthrobacter enclensis TaxID=993070 RepID=A0ABT9RZQ4_9MICC|nr:hypothetical protein [Pseudarthrobacter enclensis]MDP9890716.1 flagellar biosynthesis/type III secretory pathway protein FliH [Pseudarthrobacter enclensis]
MDDQSRPVEPQDGQGTEDAERNASEERAAGVPAAEQTGKLRPAYLDPRGSESTRELRDTARRRRDAEEKLQQHLMEAKRHVPNEFHEHHEHGHAEGEHAGHEHAGRRDAGPGPEAGRGPQHGDAEEGRTAGKGPGGEEP